MTDVHSCSYHCDRPECIKAQRDELRDRLAQPEQEPDRTWVGLTDEDKAELDEKYGDDTLAHLDAIRARVQDPMPLFDDWPGGFKR